MVSAELCWGVDHGHMASSCSTAKTANARYDAAKDNRRQKEHEERPEDAHSRHEGNIFRRTNEGEGWADQKQQSEICHHLFGVN